MVLRFIRLKVGIAQGLSGIVLSETGFTPQAARFTTQQIPIGVTPRFLLLHP